MSDSLTARDLGLDLDEEEPLHVHDLPQIYTKPSARTILDTLSLLTIEPRSWDGTPSLTPSSSTPATLSGTTTPSTRPRRKVRSDGVPQYLTRIISSPLAWIKDDEEKEQIWDAASVRLSERSGRTGMGDISRMFRIPLSADSINESSTMKTVIASSQDQNTGIEVGIHEPALTEDNLGLKTWASSYVLARKWHTMREELPLVRSGGVGDDEKPAILELGAGTGLVGIAAAAVFGTTVLLTDLPDIVSNLARNAEENDELVSSHGGSTTVAVIDWTNPQDVRYKNTLKEDEDCQSHTGGLSVPLIVAADPIYSKDHPQLLASAVDCHLMRSKEARLVVEMPIREAYAEERADFVRRMQNIGLEMVKESKDIGYDDWSEAKSEELAEVECWMTMWAWKDE